MKGFLISLTLCLFFSISWTQNTAEDWMKTNLKVTHFRNGDTLFYAQTKEQWQRAEDIGIPAYCTNPNVGKSEISYNWYAVNDPRGLAPSGYRIPSSNDFQFWINSGENLKTSGDFWTTPTYEESKFKAYPFGFRSYDGGDFYGETFQAFFWTSDIGKTQHAFAFLVPDEGGPQLIEERRGNAYSIRCIRNKNESIAPEKISCKQSKPIIGQTVNLSVIGGELVNNATWVWYENSKSNEIGRGPKIDVKPTEPSTYYVRASNSKLDDFVSYYVNVTDGYIEPTIIAPRTACLGNTVMLSLTDGELGTYSDWVWYAAKNGNETKRKIGTGNSITLEPNETSIYFVRPEKSNGEFGKFSSCEIKLLAEPQKADKIELISPSNICEGEYARMIVKGELTPGSEWTWELNGVKSTTGIEFNQKLYSNAEINVYASNGVCLNSAKYSVAIQVFKKSIDPYKINETEFSYNKSTLRKEGGSLGDGANWNWYKTKPNGKVVNLGSRESIVVNNRKPANYRVVATSGKCSSETNGTDFQMKDKYHGGTFSDVYANTKGIFHFGLELGGGIHFLNDSIKHPFYGDSTILYGATNFTLNGGIQIHPIINEYFTLGFRYNYLFGIGSITEKDNLTPYIGNSYSTYTFKNRHKASVFGSEALFSLGKKARLKMMMEYELASISSLLDVKTAAGDQLILNTNSHFRENVGFGVRIGSYGRSGYSKATQLDLLYTITTIHQNGLFDFSNSFFKKKLNEAAKNQWYSGIKARIWTHNSIKFETSVLFNVTQAQRKNDVKIDWGKSIVRLSLVWSFDQFY